MNQSRSPTSENKACKQMGSVGSNASQLWFSLSCSGGYSFFHSYCEVWASQGAPPQFPEAHTKAKLSKNEAVPYTSAFSKCHTLRLCLQCVTYYGFVRLCSRRLCSRLCSSHRRRRWHPTPVLLPGKSHGRRSLVGCSPWGRKESDTTVGHDCQTRLSYFAFTFHFHALEKEMATHFSVLAWRTPGTGEPGGLPSMGSHRVGHDGSDLAALGQAWRKKQNTERKLSIISFCTLSIHIKYIKRKESNDF